MLEVSNVRSCGGEKSGSLGRSVPRVEDGVGWIQQTVSVVTQQNEPVFVVGKEIALEYVDSPR